MIINIWSFRPISTCVKLRQTEKKKILTFFSRSTIGARCRAIEQAEKEGRVWARVCPAVKRRGFEDATISGVLSAALDNVGRPIHRERRPRVPVHVLLSHSPIERRDFDGKSFVPRREGKETASGFDHRRPLAYSKRNGKRFRSQREKKQRPRTTALSLLFSFFAGTSFAAIASRVRACSRNLRSMANAMKTFCCKTGTDTVVTIVLLYTRAWRVQSVSRKNSQH